MFTYLAQYSSVMIAVGLVIIVVALIQSIKVIPLKLLWIVGLFFLCAGSLLMLLAASADPGNDPFIPVPKPKPDPLIPTPPPLLQQSEILKTEWNAETETDWKRIGFLAGISEDVYLPPVDCIPQLKSRGFETIEIAFADSMICYVMRGKELTVIAFRGTDDPYDFIMDIDDSRFRLEGGFMHRGFWNSYLKLKPQIAKILKDDNAKYVWITGHSLGGALAGLCAFDRSILNHDKLTGVVTFGQPRYADKVLCREIDRQLQRRYLRLVNDRDPVTRIPPTYDFCGVVLWMKADQVVRSIPAPLTYGAGPEPMKSSDSSANELPPLTPAEYQSLKQSVRKKHDEIEFDARGRPLVKGLITNLIDDHYMINYLQKIRSQIGK